MLTQRLIQQVHLRDRNLDMDGDQQQNLSQGQRKREEERMREGGRRKGRRKGGGGERKGMGTGKHEYQPATSSQLHVYHQVGGRRK